MTGQAVGLFLLGLWFHGGTSTAYRTRPSVTAQGIRLSSEIQDYLSGYPQEIPSHYPHAPLQQQLYHPASRLAYLSAYQRINPGYAEGNVKPAPMDRGTLNHWSAQQQREQAPQFTMDAQMNGEEWKSNSPSEALLSSQLSAGRAAETPVIQPVRYSPHEQGDEGRLQDTTGGHINVKVFAPPSVKDVQDEENLDGQTGALHKESGITPSDSWKEESKKSPRPQPVQQSTNGQSSNTFAQDGKTSKEPEAPLAFVQDQDVEERSKGENSYSDVYFVAIVAGCSAAAIFGVVAAGYCFYKIQKGSKAAADVDYPAYGVTGPSKEHTTSPNGDRKLAQSAQMYHYQHQKQQMIAVEKASTARHTSASDVDSEEENEEGDYTVYECPGLAPTGEMEVKNPLFHDDSTPVSPPVVTPKVTEK